MKIYNRRNRTRKKEAGHFGISSIISMLLIAYIFTGVITAEVYTPDYIDTMNCTETNKSANIEYISNNNISDSNYGKKSYFCADCLINTIEGTALLCDGTPASGISVTVESNEGTETTTTTGVGYWQVDVGSMFGNNWTWGIPFDVTYNGNGWYGTDTGTVSSPPTCLYDCGTTYLSPDPPVSASASYDDTTCYIVGDTVQFYGSASDGLPPYSYSWDFDDGSPPDYNQNPSHQFNNPGQYNVCLTVTDSCSETDIDCVLPVVTINDNLLADAGGPYSGDKCSEVCFSGSATGGCSPYTYSWDFGDGNSGGGQNPCHEYTCADGTYTLTLTVTDECGDTDTDTASVTISTDPLVANAGGLYTGDTTNPVHFSGSASGGCSPHTYSWDFGDETPPSSQQNPTHQYENGGLYTATLTVTDDCGDTDTDTASVDIDDEPLIEADAGGPYEGVVDVPISFSGSVTGGESPYTWHWNFGDGRSDYGKNLEHTYYDAGVYVVTLTVTDDQGNHDSDTAYANVSGPDPVANANGPYYGTVDCNIQFTGSVLGGESPYTWHWDFGDGDSSTDQNPTHMYDEIRKYTVTLTVTDSDDKVDIDSTTATITPGVPDLGCTGSLSWSNVKGRETVTGSFTVENIGDPYSLLDWEVASYPDFGSDWTFTPNDGDDLTPEDGAVTVEVSVVAPSIKSMVKAALDDQEEEFNGIVKVINKDDPSDYCEIPVSITVPMNIAHNPFIELLRLLMERFPLLNAILSSW